mgnify:CR=1 FL=1
MKKLAPLLLALLAVSLWSWTQRARNPLILPTSAISSVYGVHLGASEAEVVLLTGKPGEVHYFYPKTRETVTAWTWPNAESPGLRSLHVGFEKQRVIYISGANLSLDSPDFELHAGDSIQTAAFLGNPLSSAPLQPETAQAELLTSWKFPGLALEVVSAGNHIREVRIHQPRE